LIHLIFNALLFYTYLLFNRFDLKLVAMLCSYPGPLKYF